MDVEKCILDTKKTEDFLNSLIMALSDYVIIVIGQLRYQDQVFIKRIMDIKNKFNPHEKHVFVVHNFREFEDEKDYENYSNVKYSSFYKLFIEFK